MKKIIKYILIVFIIQFVVSCTKDDNTDQQTIDVTGEWVCHDNESENAIYDERNFTIEISKNDTDYIISNYAALGIDAVAHFNKNNNSFVVEQQEVDGFQTHGTGTFSSNNKTASFTYYLDDEKIESSWSR